MNEISKGKLKPHLLWWECRFMGDDRNFPVCRAAGCPAPRWPGDGGILPAAAAAPSRCDSMAKPESRGGGTWTDLWAPKSRPSIIHKQPTRSKKHVIPNKPIGLAIMSLDSQANQCHYPAFCRPRKTKQNSLWIDATTKPNPKSFRRSTISQVIYNDAVFNRNYITGKKGHVRLQAMGKTAWKCFEIALDEKQQFAQRFDRISPNALRSLTSDCLCVSACNNTSKQNPFCCSNKLNTKATLFCIQTRFIHNPMQTGNISRELSLVASTLIAVTSKLTVIESYAVLSLKRAFLLEFAYEIWAVPFTFTHVYVFDLKSFK